MNIKKFTTYSIFLAILSIVILFIAALQSRELQRSVSELEERRVNSILLTEELFQSSEDLTRMARSYVVTSDSNYKYYFFKILAIRNGTSPRPLYYAPTYWNLKQADKEHHIQLGEAIALNDLMLRQNLSPTEIALLSESHLKSDRLVALEKQALAAVEGLFDNGHGEYNVPGEPDRKFAQDLLWGDEYIQEKARIMLPLKKFMTQLNERTQTEFNAVQLQLNQIIRLKLGILAIMLVGSIVAAVYIRRYILHPLNSLTGQAEAITNGNYSARCEVSGSNEVAALGTDFNHMANAVQQAITQHEQAEDLLRQGELRLKEAQHMAQVGNWELNLASGALYWSEEIFYIFEIDQTIFGSSYEAFLNLIHPEDRDAVNRAYNNSVETREFYEISHRLLMPDGRIKWVEERCKTFYDDQGKPISSAGTIQVITERKQSEETIKLYASVFELSGEAFVIADNEYKILATNEAYVKLTGYLQQEVLGQNLDMVASTVSSKEEYWALRNTLNKKEFWQSEMMGCHKDGHTYVVWLSITVIRNSQNQIINYIASFKDITKHKAAMDKVHHLAHHDALTDLPNRFALIERLTQAIKSARRDKDKIAVMFIDLDRFKTINDMLGHDVGDQLLVNVAKRLKSCARDSDIVARLGGDEFVVVLLGSNNTDVVFHIADKILQTLGESHSLNGHDVCSSPSIGIAFFPDDGNSIEEIMKNADVAMYHAKSNGRNNYQFFESSMNQETNQRLELENDMQLAIEREEFVLHYQPKIDANTLRVIGVEALVRWQHPKKGLIQPAKFISMAEESGLMLPLGEWVLRTACRQLKQWQENGMVDLQMSVNLSMRQFRQKNLSTMVESIVAKENIDPALLELEITESMAMDNPQETIESMHMLREIGVELAVDDFGTGYSSLSYLKQFPVNSLKLDRSYVKGIEIDPSDVVICSTTISLAHNLGLSVVAEGVETEKQYEYLKRLNCDKMQGYHFCRPLPASEAEAYIVSRNLYESVQNASVRSIDILIIDDDKFTCDFLKHLIENQGHKPTAMLDPIEGLKVIRKNPDLFEIIMLDMLMPNMSGVDAIKAIRKINFDVPIIVITSFKLDAVRKTIQVLEKDHNLLYGINYFVIEKPLTAKNIEEHINKII